MTYDDSEFHHHIDTLQKQLDDAHITVSLLMQRLGVNEVTITDRELIEVERDVISWHRTAMGFETIIRRHQRPRVVDRRGRAQSSAAADLVRGMLNESTKVLERFEQRAIGPATTPTEQHNKGNQP